MMKNYYKERLKELGGKNINADESPKTKEKKRKEAFIQIVKDIQNIHNRSIGLADDYNIILLGYEDQYFQIIEDLIVEMWGETVAFIIFWWIYEVTNPKGEENIILDERSGIEYRVNSIVQVYNVLKKIKAFK